MKVIDLLNKIANGEDIPSPIYHNNLYYDFEDGDYFNQKTRNWLFNDSDIDTILNDEVEVINEDKKIEKLDLDWVEVFNFKEQAQQDCVKMVFNKINKIIDKINKEK